MAPSVRPRAGIGTQMNERMPSSAQQLSVRLVLRCRRERVRR